MSGGAAHSRRGLLIALMSGTFMAALDNSIVNVSVPAMMRTLHASVTEVEWVVSTYMIGFAVVMPLVQWLRDRIGQYALYSGALALFTLGSFLCGLAPTLPILVCARIIQAIGGGALTPTAMAVIGTVYPPAERGRALGIWGLGVIIGPALGPTLGGVLTEHFGWPSIFLVNLPVGLLGLALCFKYLRPVKTPAPPRAEFDFPGFVFLSVFLVSFLLGASDPGRMIIPLLLSALALGAFVFVEKKTKQPLLDLAVFSNRALRSCLLVTFSRTAALYGGLFLLPMLLQKHLGYSETVSGLLLLPGSVMIAILMPLSGRWTDARGPRGIIRAGIVLLSVSTLGYCFMPYGTPWLAIVALMALRGTALGLLVTPISTAVVNSVPNSRVALATSLNSLSQQSGGAIGIALLSAVHAQAGIRGAFVTAAGLTLLGLIPAFGIPARASAPTDSWIESLE